MASESALQISIVSWARRYLPPPPDGPYWCAINPVPSKSLTAAMKSKQMGMKAGIADLLLVLKGRAIFCELKADKGALSNVQKTFAQEAILAGAAHVVIKSRDEFVGFLEMLSVPIRPGGLEALKRSLPSVGHAPAAGKKALKQ